MNNFKYFAVLRENPALHSWAYQNGSEINIFEKPEDGFPSQFYFSTWHAEECENDAQAIRVMLSLAQLFNSIQKIISSEYSLQFERFIKLQDGVPTYIENCGLHLESNEYYWPFLCREFLAGVDHRHLLFCCRPIHKIKSKNRIARKNLQWYNRSN